MTGCRRARWLAAVLTATALMPAAAAAQGPVAAARPPAARSPVPPAAALRASQARLQTAFPTLEGKAATPAAKLDQARRMLATVTSDASAADRYVLLETARGLAVEAGAVDVAIECVEKLGREFAVAPEVGRAKTLQALAPKVDAGQVARLVDELVSLASSPGDTIDADQREDLLQLAIAAARRTGARSQVETVTAALAAQRQASRLEAKERDLTAKLAESPDNAAAAQELAVIKCLVHDDWVTGLRLLQRGGDDKAAALARADLTTGKATADVLQLADGWWDYAEGARGDLARLATSRAASHYLAALEGLKGLDRPRVERRLEEANARLAKKGTGKVAARPAGLLLHLDASLQTALAGADARPVGTKPGAKVAKWLDVQSAGSSALQTAAGSMPTLATHTASGLRALRFSGQSCLVSPVNLPGEGTLFVVCQPDQPLVTGCPVGRVEKQSGVEICSRADGMMLFRVVPSVGDLEQINSDAGELSAAGTMVITVAWSMPTALRVNGESLNLWTASRRPDISDGNGLVLGARTSTGLEAFQGLLCECLLFRGLLDDATVAKVEKGLMAKWRAR